MSVAITACPTLEEVGELSEVDVERPPTPAAQFRAASQMNCGHAGRRTSGRKASVDVVQLLNIAMALRVPLIFLLAPVGRTDDPLDLRGLSREFESMTVAEFDSWLAGLPDGARRAASLDERTTTAELEALRLWKMLSTEVARLTIAVELERQSIEEPDLITSTRQRLRDAKLAAERQATLLRSAGWPI